jgi:hypothetical protein
MRRARLALPCCFSFRFRFTNMGKYLKTLAGDLLNLEINTIIRENTSSAKMPNVRRVALLKIADLYRDYIIKHGYAKKAPGESYQPAPNDKNRYFRWRYGGEFSFNELRVHARGAVEDLHKVVARMPEGQQKEDRMRHLRMMERIQEQSSNLLGLFKMRRREYQEEIQAKQEGFSEECDWTGVNSDYQPFPPQKASLGWNNDIDIQTINESDDLDLTPEHITMVRKIWEIGMEQVLLQTSVQIDGDITSVLAHDFINMPERTQQMIMKVHEDSISSSTRIWKMLFETIGKLAGQGFNKIFDRKAK